MAKIVRIFDPAAITLVNRRATAENRSAANSAATTILEALLPIYGEASEAAGKIRQEGESVNENH